jgi:hypothetical protein
MLFLSAGYSQSLAGYVEDEDTHRPLRNVLIFVPELNSHTESDSLGFWSLNASAGKYTVEFHLTGYETLTMPEIFVLSGKRRTLSASMRESRYELDAAVVRPDDKSFGGISRLRINPSALSHIPGNVNDPARMLTSMPGINNASDDRNDLVVRGNTSVGVLWRIEGVEVFNPNHYASSGTTGGAISILNPDVLGASYFYTGAFPAEFGNVFSGVFDANFREGNAERFECSAEVSNLDLNLTAEGPIRKRKSSYLVGFRQSVIPVFEIINKKYRELLGATPVYTDLSFKAVSRNARGAKTSLWGIAGTSEILLPAMGGNNTASYEIHNRSINISTGLSHRMFFGQNFSVNFVSGFSYLKTDNSQDLVTRIANTTSIDKHQFIDESKSIAAGMNGTYKPDARNLFKLGVNYRFVNFHLERDTRSNPQDNSPSFFYHILNKSYSTVNSYAEWKHLFGKRLNLTLGGHYFYFAMNGRYRIEPRISASYSVASTVVELAAGEYSRQNPIGLYMAKVNEYHYNDKGEIDRIATIFPNTDSDFIKSRQIVLSFGKKLFKKINLKAEAYYQYHYDVAIAKEVTNEQFLFVSALNMAYNAGDIDPTGILFDNTGRAYSTGVEGMVYFDDLAGFSANLSLALFKSEFETRLGWHNTLFNNSYILKTFVGKEFKHRKRNRFRLDLALNWLGGRRYMPVECELSYFNQALTYDYSRYAAERYSDYFRLDLKASYIVNRPKITHIFSVDIRNLTNRENIYSEVYSFRKQLNKHLYKQVMLFPVITYKIFFGNKL